jgi:hypothetical protein
MSDNSWVGFSVRQPPAPAEVGFFRVTADRKLHNVTVDDIATGNHILIPFGVVEQLAAAIMAARNA